MINRLILVILSILAKTLAFASRLFKKGSGTSLPGLVVENYYKWALAPLKNDFETIIFVSGTNGKTTTRAILVDIYEKNGHTVVTNRGGANIFRGLASSLLLSLNWHGKPTSDTLILEVEEATLPIISHLIPPTKLILTNIFRDQLDAYGEIDQTLAYFKQTLTLCAPELIINANDSKLMEVTAGFNGPVTTFGINDSNHLLPKFESKAASEHAINYQANNITFTQGITTFAITQPDQTSITTTSHLPGIFNIYNTLAAIVTARNTFSFEQILPYTSTFLPVFGRGEDIVINSNTISILLVKNPAGFEQVLNTVAENYQNQHINTVFLINDNIADGKDVSWLWDIDFESFFGQLSSKNITLASLATGGTRGLDMLLRLEYAGFAVTTNNNTDIAAIATSLPTTQGKTIVFATYTAMRHIREELGKFTRLSNISDAGN